MNNFKNFVIFLFSCIILIQAVLLIHFATQRTATVKVAKAVRLPPPAEKKPVAPIVKQETPVKPVVKQAPSIVMGKIALVLDDWGYNLKNRDFVTDNDFHVTLSILPFRTYSTHIAQLAFNKNKDIIVHMPMEPINKENYGLEENTLLTSMDKRTITRLLSSAFAVVPHAKGISNHMGSKATEDERFMKIVLEFLKQKDMFFLDSFVTPRSVCRPLARKLRLGFAERSIFIDNESDPSYIRQQLVRLAQKAKYSGLAVGIGHDRPATIAVLKEMIPELESQGYKFVNLSEVVETQ